jgi:hypothetical protein
MLKKEAQNYGIYIIDDRHYYIPESQKAYQQGYFMLEDTRQVMKVDGIAHNIMPTMLKFHEHDESTSIDNIPLALIATEVH